METASTTTFRFPNFLLPLSTKFLNLIPISGFLPPLLTGTRICVECPDPASCPGILIDEKDKEEADSSSSEPPGTISLKFISRFVEPLYGKMCHFRLLPAPPRPSGGDASLHPWAALPRPRRRHPGGLHREELRRQGTQVQGGGRQQQEEVNGIFSPSRKCLTVSILPMRETD